MIRRTKSGPVFYQFESFSRQRETVHAVFTRIGGSSRPPFNTLNVGQLVGDDPQAVQGNLARIFDTLGIRQDRVVTAWQVHGSHAAVVGVNHHGTVLDSTDALLTQSQDTYLLMRFADCLPLLLYDPVKRAVGLVHCGWRGVVSGVVANAVQALQESFGSRSEDTLAALGPAIRPCCYEVGPEVTEQIRQVFRNGDELLLRQSDGRAHFDLPGAVRAQLLRLVTNALTIASSCMPGLACSYTDVHSTAHAHIDCATKIW
jgi:YfiH family protein